MTTKTVARLLVETLAGAGVKRIYGVAGDSLNGTHQSVSLTDVMKARRFAACGPPDVLAIAEREPR
jgi:hypothetical protein